MATEDSEVQKKMETTNGLDLLWESRGLYAEILYSFRECHDVCVESNLYADETVLEIHQCAADFRQISLETVSIAKRVSNQWLDTAIQVFENSDKIKKPEKLLLLLGKQARELAQCFKLIAAWVRNLGGRFHQAQDGTIKEADEFKWAFKAAVKHAEEVRKQVKEQLDEKSKDREVAECTQEAWRIASLVLSWCPIGLIVTGIGRAVAEMHTVKAIEIESETAKHFQKCEQKLKEKQNHQKKAKFVAKKAGKLVKVLGKLEEICEAVAAFWTMEADKYDSQGGKMAKNHVTQMKGAVVENNIAFWKKAKDDIEKYVTAMTVVNSCFNFVTDARPSVLKSLSLVNLGFTLRVPASIDTEM